MTPTIGTQPFDPGVALLPANLKAFNDAWKLSQDAKRIAYMALPYNQFDAQYVAGQPYRTEPSVMSAEASRSPLCLQIHVWGDDPCRTFVDALVQGYFGWIPSVGMPNFNIGPGLSDPFVQPNYDQNNPPPGAIIIPKYDATGALIPPAPLTPPVVTPPVPSTTAIIGQFNFVAKDVLGDNLMHYWCGVQWNDKSPVNTVDSTGKYIKAPFLSTFMFNPGPQLMWKSIAIAPSN